MKRDGFRGAIRKGKNANEFEGFGVIKEDLALSLNREMRSLWAGFYIVNDGGALLSPTHI